MDTLSQYETIMFMDMDLTSQYEQMQMIELGTKGYLENDHPTVEVLHSNELINIDVEMVELIQQLWDKNLQTTACCQGNDSPPQSIDFLAEYAYISFRIHNHILKFIEEYPITKHIGVFDILNPIEPSMTMLKADDIMQHKQRCGDLYSVRFNKEYIPILLGYE